MLLRKLSTTHSDTFHLSLSFTMISEDISKNGDVIVIRKFQNCLATYLELFFYPKVIIILLSINVIISTPYDLTSCGPFH